MTENQSDRLQEIQDMMAELQSLRIGPPVKSMVVVQSDEPNYETTPASRPEATVKRKPSRRLMIGAGVVLAVVAVIWLARGRYNQPADAVNAPGAVAESRLAKLQRAVTRAKSGDADAALGDVEQLTNTDCTPEELLTAAAAFASASGRTTLDRVLAEHRAARAVLFLRRAHAQGLVDINALYSVAELAPLQHRSDFQQLVVEIMRR